MENIASVSEENCLSIQAVSEATGDIGLQVEAVSAGTHYLVQIVKKLQTQVARFKLDGAL